MKRKEKKKKTNVRKMRFIPFGRLCGFIGNPVVEITRRATFYLGLFLVEFICTHIEKESFHFPFDYLWYHIGRRLSSSWNKKWKKNTIFKGKRRKDNDSIRCVGVLTKGCDYLFHARLTHNSTHVDRDVLQQQLFSFSLSRVIGHTREERMKERKMNIKRNAMTLFSPFFSCCCVKVVVRRLYDSGWIATARFSDFCIIIRNIRKEKKKVI